MSKKYTGGLITKTPVTPAGPYQSNAASGVWTLDQQARYKQQGIWPTVGLIPNYVEDVFSTYLYTGTGTIQSIPNGLAFAPPATSSGYVGIQDRGTPYYAWSSYISSTGQICFACSSQLITVSSTGTKVSQTNQDWNINACFTDGTNNYFGVTDGSTNPSRTFIYKTTASTGAAVSKYTISGSYVSNSIDTPYAIEVDASGNIFVYGLTRSDGPTFFYYPYLIKLNSSFVIQWYKSLGGATGTTNSISASLNGSKPMCLDSAGNIYVVWNTGSTPNFILQKYNTSGTLLNTYSITNVTDITCVYVDSSNNIYIGGCTATGHTLCKLDSAFTVQWSKNITGISTPYSVGSVAVDASGNVYCGCGDGMVAAFSSSGTTLFQRRFNYSGSSTYTSIASIRVVGSSLYLVSLSGQIAAVPTDGTGTGGFAATMAGTPYVLSWYATNQTIAAGTVAATSTTITAGSVTYSIATNTNSVTTPSTTNISSTSFAASTASYSSGLVWQKSRSAILAHSLFDTSRGINQQLISNSTAASANFSNSLIAFNSNGVTLGTGLSTNTETDVLWSFKKQAKFFDVVTWTGNGTAGRTITHNLGSVPGCIIVKRTDTTGNWAVYHRGVGATGALLLNLTITADIATGYWQDTAPTSSVFSVGGYSDVNASGGTYVAYLFAHDAGGFGNFGTDNVITCGTFTTNSSGNATVSLGYEPQWALFKDISAAGNWFVFDNMRGWSTLSGDNSLSPNTTAAEATTNIGSPEATGFSFSRGTNTSYVYIAIRRGPMRTPTLGTDVYTAVSRTGTAANTTVASTFPVDLAIIKGRTTGSDGPNWGDRLRGGNLNLYSNTIGAETAGANDRIQSFAYQSAVGVGSNAAVNDSAGTYINWFLRRVPGFFDIVCYTGTGSAGTQTHNLGVAPELIIVKKRSAGSTTGWLVGAAPLGYGNKLYLNLSDASAADSTAWNSTSPTSNVFSLGTNTDCNASGGATFVAYLFATLAGVSKVGSYTGTGALQVVNCGFTTGARFVMIKRTNVAGDWYVWDSVRGMVSGTDPYLLMDSFALETTGTNYVFSSSTGFTIQATAPADINASGGTYIYLAIA